MLLGLAIAATAVLLRASRLGWALSDGTCFPDEIFWSQRAALFVPLSWSAFAGDALVDPYPALYGILTGLAAAAAHALGVSPFGQPELDAMLAARVVSAVTGVATVGLVWLLARRLDSQAVAVAAAALMAVVPLHVMQTYYASVDVVLTACVALVTLTAYAVVTRSGTWHATLLGAAAGLAFASKYTGLAMLATAGLAVAERALHDRSLRRGLALGSAAAAGFVAAVALACPPCVLRSGAMLAAMRYHSERAAHPEDFIINHLVPSLGWYGRPWLYQLVAALPYVLGWPVYGLVLLGVAAAVRRRDAGDRVLLATVVPYFAAIGASRVTLLRYLLPMFPAMVVLAARSAPMLPGRRTWAGLVAGASLYALALSVTQIARYSMEPRMALARWVASLSSPRRPLRVAVPETLHPYALLAGPFLRVGISYIPVPDGAWFASAPDVFVLPELHEVAIRRDRPGSAAADELARLEAGALPYRVAQRFPSWYLQRDLYIRLDPGFAISEGGMGYTVWVHEPSVP